MRPEAWLAREVAPGVTLRDLAWALYRTGAYRPPTTEIEMTTLRKIQIRTAESLGKGLSRIVPRMPYSHGNRKIGDIWSFDLPPVLTCPYATFCGRSGPQGLYKGKGYVCYDLNTARYSRQHLLREYLNYIHIVKEGYEWLSGWTKFVVHNRGARIIRLHVGGDIFSAWYWDFIKRLAGEFPTTTFYLYTRSFPIIAASPERPKNLVILMSLDAANFSYLYKYGEYFDNITYLLAGEGAEAQIPLIRKAAEWAEKRGKRLVVFLEHSRRKNLINKMGTLKKYICPNEVGMELTCEKCRICFTKSSNHL